MTSTAAVDSVAQEGHDELTSEMCHIWVLSEFDPLLLSPYPNATHATREVLEDLMLEEIAASFASTSACTCASSMRVSHPAQLTADSVPPGPVLLVYGPEARLVGLGPSLQL
jgi:hypothetical protein